MRLPLRHPPPGRDAPLARCAHLEALADASLGLALAPAAGLFTARRSRGRFGNALQWHFGLDPHDGLPRLDWEDRIELKVVSVWRRGGAIVADKLKVCDLALDPWHKLSNVLFVFVDRLTRVVVGHRFWRLAGPAREALEASWRLDPHFDRPHLFVEAREQDERQAPAYYVSASWLREAGILPRELPGVFTYDAAWWREARASHRRAEPFLTLWRGEAGSSVPCPRCGGRVQARLDVVREEGGAPAVHALPGGAECALRAHYVIDAGRLPIGPGHPERRELEAALEGRVASEQVWRLADRVAEPEDHLH
ncbi:MAG: hypothetical protein H6711_05985 [Myxococcales bacterium]|nr:hypothetical protein [Myxococcales bacterium]